MVGGAIVCAAISNLSAAPARRLPWVGDYPNARTVPVLRAPTPGAAAVRPGPSASAAPAASETATKEYPPHPDKPWIAITGEEAVALHRKGIPFLDARRSAVYAEGHIAGARSFPIWESTVDDQIKRLFEEGYDVNAPLVVYCSGGDCEDSHMLAERLHRFGFNNALVYADGFPDWEKRRLPVEKGAPK
ncbi:MAG: rhodanese-like domain-containing protein [Acidobacteriota bacterium]